MFYKELKPYLNRAKTVTKLNQLLEREKEQINLCGLNKSAKSLFVAHIFSQTRKDVILATLDDTDAENFRDDLHILLGENKVCHFPNYEVLPYEQRSPHFSRILPRIETLYKALYSKSNVYIISIQEFLRYINNPQNFSDLIYNLILGEEYNLTELISDLVNMGYKYKPSIEQVGDISKRGGIFDIFVPNNHYPFRIEFCGNIIESIRQFSVATQVSFKKDINEIQIQPMRELSIKNINKDIPSYFQDKIDDDLFYEGIEQDVPLLIKESVPFISYFDQKWTIAKRPILIFDEFSKLSVKIKQIKEEVVKHYENILKRKKRELIVPPEKLFADESFLDKIKAESHLIFLNRGYTKICEHTVYVPVKTQACFGGKIDILEDRISALLRENYQIFIQSDNKIQSKRLEEIVPSYDDRVRYNTGVFCNGFQFEEAKLAIFTDHEIFSRYRMSRRIYRFSPEQSLPDYESLKLNDYIVHIDYGIGIYRGLKVLKINGNEVEMIVIGYANNDKVYVPTNQLNLVTKFVANDGVVPEINRIGDSGWSRLKNKVRKNIEEIAQDLVELYAKRKVQKGYAFDKDTEWQKNLEASFIYQETPDQERVSQEIKNDMESLIPMDRLICGDVGFGKTELAVRAAFKAVLNGKQVAILVPTTVLAEQHFITFSERLADYPIVIDMLSRFKAKSRQNQIVENLKNGLIDIIIGTHRLLSNDIKFNELGLLIIDEEQRFGVNHKEKLKKKYTNIDVITLTATPIPRTLNMALSGIRDLSVMNTAPRDRLPIRTTVIPFDQDVIKDAIERELDRNGQIFFIHNRVQTIEKMTKRLQAVIPNASFYIAHGQMPEKELEKIILDFYHNKFDVLVCTTIMENGVDIPNVNTIIINHADRFGLAELYQLRGRIGRSNHQAYAYLIMPEHTTAEAKKRLEIIEETDALGSGFKIAMRDLEMRGVGNILGTKQHGIMNAIGYNYYNKLLERAIDKYRQSMNYDYDIFEEEKSRTSIICTFPHYIPGTYIEDEQMRLDIYRRFSELKNTDEFVKLQYELTDRFGKMSTQVENAFNFLWISRLANILKLKSVMITNQYAVFKFNDGNCPDISNIADFMKIKNIKIEFDISNGLSVKLLFQTRDMQQYKNSSKYQILTYCKEFLESI